MIDKENKRNYILYFFSMLAVGAAQLLDWYFGSEDPIWHIFLYSFDPDNKSHFYLADKRKGNCIVSFPILFCALYCDHIYLYG